MINLQDIWKTYSKWAWMYQDKRPELLKEREKVLSSLRSQAFQHGPGWRKAMEEKLLKPIDEQVQIIEETWQKVGAEGADPRKLLTGEILKKWVPVTPEGIQSMYEKQYNKARAGVAPGHFNDIMEAYNTYMGEINEGRKKRDIYKKAAKFVDAQGQPVKWWVDYYRLAWKEYFRRNLALEAVNPEAVKGDETYEFWKRENRPGGKLFPKDFETYYREELGWGDPPEKRDAEKAKKTSETLTRALRAAGSSGQPSGGGSGAIGTVPMEELPDEQEMSIYDQTTWGL